MATWQLCEEAENDFVMTTLETLTLDSVIQYLTRGFYFCNCMGVVPVYTEIPRNMFYSLIRNGDSIATAFGAAHMINELKFDIFLKGFLFWKKKA